LERLGSDLVDAIADLEFGLSQELVVGFGREQVGQKVQVGVDGLP
jgi:hypothetical protein